MSPIRFLGSNFGEVVPLIILTSIASYCSVFTMSLSSSPTLAGPLNVWPSSHCSELVFCAFLYYQFLAPSERFSIVKSCHRCVKPTLRLLSICRSLIPLHLVIFVPKETLSFPLLLASWPEIVGLHATCMSFTLSPRPSVVAFCTNLGMLEVCP
jgi:hypothetical protein